LEDVVPVSSEAGEFFPKMCCSLFRFLQRFGQLFGASAFANEIDKVGYSPFLGIQFRLSQADGLRNVGVEFVHF